MINSESDNNLAKRVIAGQVDATVSTVPGLAHAWALSQALLGNAAELRQNKAIEWIEMIRDNPSIFTKQVLETEEFQDAFASCFEDYIKERNDDKRILLQEIFKDYTSSRNPETYPLERFNEITKQITVEEAKRFSYLMHLSSEYPSGKPIPGEGPVELVLHLISLGLLIRDDTPKFAKEGKIEAPDVFISKLGTHYYQFIKEGESKSEGLKR